jgi:GDP/UDP-N,N'-diacetylbacillosamine 2-epimerase (hydrolysing)
LDRPSLEKELGIDLGERSLLVTWHPVTWEPGRTKLQFQYLLEVLEKLDDIKLIFTKANADNEGRQINKMIDVFVGANAGRAVVFASLGQARYLSTLKLVSGVIGNSSSGIIEAPSVGTGTVNIGSRQGGRIHALSVIDCEPAVESIEMAIDKLFDPDFKQSMRNVSNPYDQGGASDKIVDVLRSHPLDGILKKKFFDISFAEKNR